MGNGKITIKLTDRTLIDRFGVTPTMDYKWAMQRIREGKAVIYNKPSSPPAGNPSPATPQSTRMSIHQNTQQKLPALKHYPEIVWLQDNNCLGGAEISGQLVIDVGRRLGYDIYVLTPQNFNLAVLRQAKLVIINNIWTFNITQMVELKRAIFEFQVPYIKYEHDFRELAESKLEFSRRLFKNSLCNVFISPLHLKLHQDKIYDMSPCYVFPLAIDVDMFVPNPKIKRNIKKAVHTSGNLHNKGAQSLFAMVKSHPEIEFEIFIGGNSILEQMFTSQPNVVLSPRVDNNKMPDVYSEAGFLVHLPIFPCAGERVAVEAALCGCKLLINDNVGHKSWGWDFEDTAKLREILRQAPYEFWKAVADAIQLTV